MRKNEYREQKGEREGNKKSEEPIVLGHALDAIAQCVLTSEPFPSTTYLAGGCLHKQPSISSYQKIKISILSAMVDFR